MNGSKQTRARIDGGGNIGIYVDVGWVTAKICDLRKVRLSLIGRVKNVLGSAHLSGSKQPQWGLT